jgi:hypothetical protein
MPAALGGYPSVAVRAANLAALDLIVDCLEAVAEPREARDVVPFGSDVIEVEDKRVSFAAIEARAPRQDRVEMSNVAYDRRAGVRPLRQF